MLTRISIIAAGIAIASTAHAQAPAQPAAEAPKQLSKTDFTKNVDSRFAALDTNHDGTLTKDEVTAAQAKALQQAQAIEQQRLDVEFKKLDTNNDGSLSLAEFRAIAPSLKPAQTPDQMISELDTNKDGKISAAEYRTPQLANFDKADANHDGVLTAQEVAAVRRK